MKNLINFILVALFFAPSVSAFSQSANPSDFSQLIYARFERQVTNFPQEKIYLQTDKPYYSAGEEIWFKAYLVNETTLEPNPLSQFVYVELINKMDSVLYRVKIKKDSLGFAGHIKLKPEIFTGTYSLRAYTYWMQNVGNDFFFSKNILIGNKIDDRITSKITYGTAVDGLIPATLTFIDAAQNPIAGKRVDIKQNRENAKKKTFSMITAKDGTVKWHIAIDPKDDSKRDIQVSMDDEKYKTTISLPEFSFDFDVQFFPESGNLLDNVLQCVGFKAIGKDGLSVDITGKVFTDKNEEICELSTLVNGMGKFSIKTQPNERYYALVKRANGIEKRVELPKTQTTGAAIQLVYNRGKILYKVSNYTKFPNESLYLLLHSRGKAFVVQSLRNLEGQISESLLPGGIVSLSVIDSLGNTYCERLSFVRNFNFPTVSMQSDKPVYSKRELVNLDFNVLSQQGNPVKGNFAISVTDQKTVKQDSLADNIISNLLLTSDIKGYVEEPETYLVDNKTATREKTDVLMLTQGWRRFNTADIVKASYQPPKFYMEAGQVLSGKVINLFNKPSRKCGIIMIPSYNSSIKLVQTDSLGRYTIDGIQFPDSSSFILKAKKKKTLGDVEIIPDPDVFPKPTVYIPTPLKANVATVEQDEYFNQSKEKYFTDGGMRVINLGEVTVKAAKKKPDFIDSIFPPGFEDALITSEKMKQYPGQNIFDILSITTAGFTIVKNVKKEDGTFGTRFSIDGKLRDPMVFVDDNSWVGSIDDLNFLNSDEVESISVFREAATIVIRLKKLEDRKSQTPISLTKVTPLGYQKPAEFYVPKYDVDSVRLSEKADLRTTIYWNPKLETDDNGNVHVSFYTADKANNYSVVMEGITTGGEICRYVGMLKREDK
jgi:hypothetical protein